MYVCLQPPPRLGGQGPGDQLGGRPPLAAGRTGDQLGGRPPLPPGNCSVKLLVLSVATSTCTPLIANEQFVQVFVLEP